VRSRRRRRIDIPIREVGVRAVAAAAAARCSVERGISQCVQSFGGRRVSVTVPSVCDRPAAA